MGLKWVNDSIIDLSPSSPGSIKVAVSVIRKDWLQNFVLPHSSAAKNLGMMLLKGKHF